MMIAKMGQEVYERKLREAEIMQRLQERQMEKVAAMIAGMTPEDILAFQREMIPRQRGAPPWTLRMAYSRVSLLALLERLH